MYTGCNTVWLRYWGCNLQCSGFGQKDPTNPETYILPYKDFDVALVNRLEDLPVWDYGCDSSYTWSKKFKCLSHSDTAEDLAKKLMDLMTADHNPYGTFLNDYSQSETHMCFTGGEPLLAKSQRDTIALMQEFEKYTGGIMPGTTMRRSNNLPRYVTFETNGTQNLTKEFSDYFKDISQYTRIMFSVSPKLFTVSGERNEKAIKPEVVKSYSNISTKGQLKFVLGPEDRQWDELDRVVKEFRAAGVSYPVFIMPVGATEAGQQAVAKEVTLRALSLGYNVSARVHVSIFGNEIGR
jgi:organic radical activating enzyme